MDATTVHAIGGLQITQNDVVAETSELFLPISQEVALVRGRTVVIRPHNLIDSGPLEFTIAPQGGSYLQLPLTRLYIKYKIVDDAGEDHAATVKVAPVNLAGNSLFKTIDIELNGQLISDLTNTFSHIKGYLEHLISYSPNTHHMRAAGWAMDTAGKFDDQATANEGYKSRESWNSASKVNELMFPLASDFFNSDRLLLPGVKTTVRLTRTSDSTYLMAGTGTQPKVKFIDAKLYVHFVDVHELVKKNHKSKIMQNPALLPMNKVVMKQYAFAGGMQQALIPNAFMGTLPKSVLVGMVDQDAFNGSYLKNPYNFQNYGLSYLCMRVNGVQKPADPYTPDFSQDLYMREFREFYDNIGIGHNDQSTIVTPKLYKDGCSLFAFDMSPDQCGGFHYHPSETGTMDMELRFKANLDGAIYVILMATYDSCLKIDNNMNIDVTAKA
jgi:hypothetical protein